MKRYRSIRNYLSELAFLLWHWEHWHWLIKYIPLLPAWLWYCLKARSFWFFTASNPTLTFGGFAGESKKEMYDQLPSECIPRTIYVSPSMPFSEVGRCATRSFTFPVAVKPDIGRMGLMFRRIDSLAALRHYHLRMQYDYILQEYIDYPFEVSVFYYRLPDMPKGTISGFVRKEPLIVTGNGKSTLHELMLQSSRLRFRVDEMLRKHGDHLDMVVREGETYVLSDAFNLSRGGRLVSLAHENDEGLLGVFDALSHSCRFYFGRYDIKCASIEDLRQGKNFSILEYNGSGAEPHHIYGNGNSLMQALKILVHHWDALSRISRVNFAKGVPRWSFEQGYLFFMQSEEYVAKLRQLDSALYNKSSIGETQSAPAKLVPDAMVS